MNFEKNRLDILKQLDEIKKKNAADKSQGYREQDLPVLGPANAGEDIPLIAFFGAPSTYKRILVERLARDYRVVSLENSEVAIQYCLDKKVHNIILDMDPPTAWQHSTDLYSAVKTMNPDAVFLICSRQTDSIMVKSLLVHGGFVTEVPVSTKKLSDFLEHCR